MLAYIPIEGFISIHQYGYYISIYITVIQLLTAAFDDYAAYAHSVKKNLAGGSMLAMSAESCSIPTLAGRVQLYPHCYIALSP